MWGKKIKQSPYLELRSKPLGSLRALPLKLLLFGPAAGFQSVLKLQMMKLQHGFRCTYKLSPVSLLPTLFSQSWYFCEMGSEERSTEFIQSLVVLGEAREQFCFHHLCHYGSGRSWSFTGP